MRASGKLGEIAFTPTYEKQKWRVGAGAFVSVGLHVAVAASLLMSSRHADINKASNAANKTISVVSLLLDPHPTFATVKPLRTDTISTLSTQKTSAAGPIASPKAQEAVALPSLPKNMQNEMVASVEGTEIAPKLLGGVMIDDNLIPPQIPSLRAKIWIDEAGQATQVELLDDIKDENASTIIIAALMDALYIPAQRDGKTVASIALMQFSRSDVEFSMPLTEPSSVVTPFDSSIK